MRERVIGKFAVMEQVEEHTGYAIGYSESITQSQLILPLSFFLHIGLKMILDQT